MIFSADDPLLDPFRDLTRRRDADAPMVLEGFNVLQRLTQHGHPVQRVLCTPDAAARLDAAAILPAGVPRWVAPAEVLRAVVGFDFHRGVLALAARPVYRQPAVWRTLVVGERITDPSNVGALIRNAAALGADAVWFDLHSGDPFSRRAIRASMGLGFALPVAQVDLVPALAELRDAAPDAVWVAASCDARARALHAVHWPARCVLFVGNEGAGLSPRWLEAAQLRVRIPMAPAADSLNVAAASAVLLYARGATASP